MKDPAVLFYTNDFLSGTFTMTNEQVGAYIRLLCLQHQKYELTEKDMENICKTYDEDIYSKFIYENGKYYNQRMREEAIKRKQYSESRRNNRIKNKNGNLSLSYVKHMENENENEDINTINIKSNGFKKPTLEQIKEYSDSINFNLSPSTFFDFYESKGWVIGKNKMKDWKAAVRTWKNKSYAEDKPIKKNIGMNKIDVD